MKDPIKVLALILLITLIIFVDMCESIKQQKEFEENNTYPDTVKIDGVKIKIC